MPARVYADNGIGPDGLKSLGSPEQVGREVECGELNEKDEEQGGGDSPNLALRRLQSAPLARRPRHSAPPAPRPRPRQEPPQKLSRRIPLANAAPPRRRLSSRQPSVLKGLGQLAQTVLGEDNRVGADDDVEGGDASTLTRNFDGLLKQLIEQKLISREAIQAPITAWRHKNLAGVDDPRVLALVDQALPSVIARLVRLELNQHQTQKRAGLIAALLILCDTVSEKAVCAVLIIAESPYGFPMLLVVLASLLTQALLAHFVTSEGPIAVVGALFGFKPIIDVIKIIFNIPIVSEVDASSSSSSLTPNRRRLARWSRSTKLDFAAEMSMKSIPLAIMQALALVEQRSIAQWISFVVGIINIAHAVASVDYHVDTQKYWRCLEPKFFGCYPSGVKGNGLFASTATFVFGFVTAKLVAVATLGATARVSLALVMLGESIALLLVRYAIGNWRVAQHIGDNTVISLTCHFIVQYPLMIAAPFPMLRHPFFLSPLVWSGFIAWSLCAANPLMLALALSSGDNVPLSIDPWVVWVVLAGATILSILATLVAFVLMEPASWHSFSRHITLATHIREFHWVRSTKWDGTRIERSDQLDEVRGRTLGLFACAFWPVDLARAWAREGWARWLSQSPPPVWFTPEWRALLPEDWFDSDETSVAVPLTKQESNFRRAMGAERPPWDLNPRDLEAYFDERFVNSVAFPASKSAKAKRRQLSYQLVGAGGVGLLERCCVNDTKSPWVKITCAANGEPLYSDQMLVKQLTSFLCSSGLSFYYQLFVASASHSPLLGYEYVKGLARKPHYEMMLVRNRQTQQLAVLTLTSTEHLEATRMAKEKKTLSDIQKACDGSEFVTALYHWGTNGGIVFILGEHCAGDRLTKRIRPDIGVEGEANFWRYSYQIAKGIADIHRAGLTGMGIRVRPLSRDDKFVSMPD